MSQASHILLIDNNRGTRETLSDVLRLKGYAVETAGLGHEGLKKLSTRPFDAAIVDIKLPDISGLDLLRLIKEASPGIEVILITAYASLNSAIQAVSGDSFAYITKPFEMNNLLLTLEKALEKRRLTMENRKLFQVTLQELAERTRTEEELRESETIFRSLVESANDAIILSDGSGKIVSWNRAAQSIFGYGKEEMLDKPLTVLMPERYRDAHQKGLERLGSTGFAHVLGKTIELHGLRKDGSEFPLEISLTTWKKGRRTFYSGIIRDITERKRAEEQIQRQRQRLAVLHEIDLATTSSLDLRAVLDILMAKIGSLLSNFATEVWLYDLENGQLVRIACGNLDKEEWMRRDLRDTPPLLKAALEQKVPLFVNNVQTDPRIVDSNFFRKHGLVSYLGVPLIAKGEALGVITFMTRKEHQFSKEESEFLSTLAGQAAIAIYNSQLFEQLEKRTRELSSLYSISTVVNKSLDLDSILSDVMYDIMEIFHFDAARIYLFDEDSKELRITAHQGFPKNNIPYSNQKPGQGIIGRVFDTGEPLFFEDIQNSPDFHRQARRRTLLREGFRGHFSIPIGVKGKTIGVMNFVSKEPHHFSPGENQLIHSIANHVGIAVENARLFEQTRKQVVELERANRVKSEFLNIMSHEFRTPLNIIIGSTEMIQEGMLGEVAEEQGKFLRKAMKSSHELLSMINSILVAAKIETEGVNVESCEFRVGGFLGELQSAYDALLEKELPLTWDYPSDLPVMETDPEKLKQILQNLINNAIKFTQKGSVTVSARYSQRTETVEFKVADTGIGIPKEVLPFIFDKFRQLDSSDTRLYGGTGLGLYIVKMFTDVLGGTVKVKSEPGRGSVFRVTVPVKPKTNHHQGRPRPRPHVEGRSSRDTRRTARSAG